MTYLVLVFFLFGSRAISKSFAASFQRFRFRVVLACVCMVRTRNISFAPLNLSKCSAVEFFSTLSKFKTGKFVVGCSLRPTSQWEVSRCGRVVTSAKFAKKRDARAELLLLLSVVPKSVKHVQSSCFVYQTNVF